SLVVSLRQVLVEALGLTDDHTGPEEVDVSVPPRARSHGVSLEQVAPLRNDPEAPHEIGPELLGVRPFGVPLPRCAPLVDAVRPCLRESVQALANLSPVKQLLHRIPFD